MPLRDHFHPPVGHQLPWESLHSGWIARLAERLNELLPEGYVALDTVRVGGRRTGPPVGSRSPRSFTARLPRSGASPSTSPTWPRSGCSPIAGGGNSSGPWNW